MVLVSKLTTADCEILRVGLRNGRGRSRRGRRIGRLGIDRGLTVHRALALRSRWVSRSRRIVIIVYGPATRLARHVTTSIRLPGDRLLTWRGSIVVSLLRELRQA